jgi:hypothetical protein
MVLVAEILRRRRLEARAGEGIRHSENNSVRKSWIIQCLAIQMVPSGAEQDPEFHWMHNEVAHRTREPSVQLGHAHSVFINVVPLDLYPSRMRRHLTRRGTYWSLTMTKVLALLCRMVGY